MLGLVFLKYVSDAFDIRRKELRAQFTASDQDYYIVVA
jgi:type I restriction enzyme M protein